MQINSICDFRKAMRTGPYAWPGGYPLYFVLSDGEALSFATARAEVRRLLEALRDYASDPRESSGWRPVAMEINYEDTDLYCAHSGDKIECAYGED